MIPEEPSPPLNRVGSCRLFRHATSDSPLTDEKTELEEFSMNPRDSSTVFGSHATDQLADLVACVRSPRSPRHQLPECAEAFPVPTDDSLGFDDDESLSPARPHVAKEKPEEPVTSAKPRPRSSLFHDRELLAQGSNLDGEVNS